MITLNEVLEIHEILLNEFGGMSGVRNVSVLESAIKRPYAGVSEREFYPTTEEKAAAILESIITGHPFNDGNKRTGYVLMRLLLRKNRIDIYASEEEKYKVVIAVASGELKFEGIVMWIKNHVAGL